MKILTMVMRCGLPKSDSNAMTYVCIGDDYSIVRLSAKDIKSIIASKKYLFTNLGIENGNVVSTNGAIDKYTLINATSNAIEGKASPVVLNRIETNGQLAGYTIFNAAGILREVNVANAVAMHAKTPFANGKIRHTQQGDIITSINGNYILRETAVPDKQVGTYTVDLIFVGSAIGAGTSISKYAGVILNYENAADLTRMYDKLEGHNAKLLNSAKILGATEQNCESLRFQRMEAAGIYAVLPINVVIDLIKSAGGKVTNSIGKITIACVDYSDRCVESSVAFSSDFKLINTINGSSKTDKSLKVYVDEVITALKAFKIEK